jgi:hypothetical protein
MTKHPIGRVLTTLGEYAAHPAAFGLALLYTAAWLVFDRESFDFHGATELIVLCITLFIVRSEHRDTQQEGHECAEDGPARSAVRIQHKAPDI